MWKQKMTRATAKKVEHPGIHGSIQFKRNGKVTYQVSRPQFPRELPEFIQGDDLKICQYRREGHSYGRIAEIMSTTENAVKKRIQKMYNRNQEMKAAGEL
jgi:hypothetical protein